MNNKEIKKVEFTADITVSYDYSITGMFFEEAFERFENKDYLFFFHEWGSKKQLYISDLIEISTGNSIDILMPVLGWDNEDLEDYTEGTDIKQELIEEIMCLGYDLQELMEELDNNGVEYKQNFVMYSTRGYSQGDYAEVIVMNENENENMQQFIDNTFWDAPVYVRIELDANQIYEWDGGDIGLPQYWNYPYDMEDCKKDVKKFLQNEFKYAAAKDKVINTVLNAFPKDVHCPNY